MATPHLAVEPGDFAPLALLTVTDDLTTGGALPAEDRETGFGAAARLALAAGLS